MILKDLLTPGEPINEIYCRIYALDGEDMLFGICHWDGEQLISDDGDNYSVTEIVSNHEWTYNGEETILTYWVNCTWS